MYLEELIPHAQILQLAPFELDTKVYVWGTNRVRFEIEVLVYDFKYTISIFVYA